MRSHFLTLSEPYSAIDEADWERHITFYSRNRTRIENLKEFETEDELYLAVVLHRSYGRALMETSGDFGNARIHLEIARRLLKANSERFDIDLSKNVLFEHITADLIRAVKGANSHWESEELSRELDSLQRGTYDDEEKSIESRIGKTLQLFVVVVVVVLSIYLVLQFIE